MQAQINCNQFYCCGLLQLLCFQLQLPFHYCRASGWLLCVFQSVCPLELLRYETERRASYPACFSLMQTASCCQACSDAASAPCIRIPPLMCPLCTPSLEQGSGGACCSAWCSERIGWRVQPVRPDLPASQGACQGQARAWQGDSHSRFLLVPSVHARKKSFNSSSLLIDVG